jgi:atypical dual specificity phosphatase
MRDESDLNFSWVIDKQLAGCAGPATQHDARFLYSEGIRAIVRLAHPDTFTDVIMPVRQLRLAGLAHCDSRVRDFSAPRMDQVVRVVRFIRRQLENGSPVAVSCGAGFGRSGTVLACYLVSEGWEAERAITLVRSKRPGSIEELDSRGRSTGQREAILRFQELVRSGRVPL